MTGRKSFCAIAMLGLFFLMALWTGPAAQGVPTSPPQLSAHDQILTVNNFTGADQQNLSILPSGAARLDHGERVWAGEFKVDPGGSNQYDTSVAAGRNGRCFVAWQQGTGSPNWDIYGQVFERGGKRVGGEIAICTAQNDQWYPGVASDGKGNFLVAWEDRRGSEIQIYALRYDADGKRIGSELTVSTGPSYKSHVAVAGRPDGSFVLAWRDDRDGTSHIYGRVLDNAGKPLSDEIGVSSGASGQDNPDVAVDGQGRFVVVWYVQDGNDYRIEGQRFDSGANKVGTALAVSSGGYGQFSPKVAMDSKSNIIAAWVDGRDYNTNMYDIYAARFDWTGDALGAQIAVATGPKTQSTPVISIDGRDNILVCWIDSQQSTSRIGSRLFGPQGETLDDFQYMTSPFYNYYYLSLAVDPEDNFMAAWGTTSQSGSQTTAAPLLQTFRTRGSLATGSLSPEKLVWWGTLSAGMSLGSPSSNSVAFELSTDGGATWSAVPDNGSLAGALGKPLKVRAFLSTSDNLTTPVLNNITLSYTWNTPPSVTAPTVLTAKKGREVMLTANGTDPDLDDAASLTYRWNQTSGKPLGLANVTGKSLTFKAPPAGKFTFTVVSSDAFASSQPATVTLTISEDKKADEGLPLLPIVGAVVIVAVVIGILAVMMMRRKPTTVIQYQPPPPPAAKPVPAPALAPAGQYQPAPLGSATPMPQGIQPPSAVALVPQVVPPGGPVRNPPRQDQPPAQPPS